jgi:hypothetical protein
MSSNKSPDDSDSTRIEVSPTSDGRVRGLHLLSKRNVLWLLTLLFLLVLVVACLLRL